MTLSLHKIINEQLTKVVARFNKDQKRWLDKSKQKLKPVFFTERDLVMYTYKLLSKKIKNYHIHSELIPYRYKNKHLQIIRKDGNRIDWKSYPSGMKIDLCVIDPSRAFFDAALDTRIERAPKKERIRSRVSLYPMDGFKASIEFKVQAGEEVEIKKDIKKLSTMCSSNPDFIGYFVLCDRSASKEDLDSRRQSFDEIKNKTKSNIYWYMNTPLDNE